MAVRTPSARWSRQEAAAVQREGDVLEQSNECENGTEGCPGPDAPTGVMPCSDCFFEGGDGS